MAIQVPNGLQQFSDANGIPLAGGSVTFYTPGTTTFKSTWQDAAATILNTNPVILDGAGRASIWGDGTYRQVVTDALGNQIWDQVTSASTAGSSSGFPSGISVGGSGIVVSSGGAGITGDVAIDGSLNVNNGVATINNPAGPSLVLSGNAGTNRAIYFRTASGTPDRWVLGGDSTPESGGNSGSSLVINRYADDGSFLNTSFSIDRATGIVHLTDGLVIGSMLLQTDGNIFMPWFGGGEFLSNILNQRVRTADSPSFAGLSVGGNSVLTAGSVGAGAGWQRDASGMITQFGQNVAGTTSGIQNYSITFPHGVGFIGLTPFNVGAVLNVSFTSTSGFAWGTTSATGFYYMAVGN